MNKPEVYINNHGPHEKGYIHAGHRHFIDHYTFVHEGTTISIKYRAQQNTQVKKHNIVSGPAKVFIAAGLFHEIEVLSEVGSWDCEFTVPEGFEGLEDLGPYYSNDDHVSL